MPKAKTTRFNDQWLEDPDISTWLLAVPGNPQLGRCTWCKSNIYLSNMGKRALLSHANSTKHKQMQNARNTSRGIEMVFRSKSTAESSSTPATYSTSQTRSSEDDLGSVPAVPTKSDPETDKSRKTLPSYLLPDGITSAEILWCLHSVITHRSMRTSAESVALFPLMFPDSQFASKMQLQRTKMGYSVVYGLAPYFHNELVNECRGCSEIVVGFDESLNKVAQLGQMDIVVRFWNSKLNQVTTRYFSSGFLNHATSQDLLLVFKKVLSEVHLNRLLQVSMDGPNVNHKFLRDLQDDLVSGPNDPFLLDIGSCGLHNMNGAFKAGIKATSWEIVQFLRALYLIFKDSPARRGDYTFYSGSKTFPKKFCSVRWLENIPVAGRAVEILPSLKKYEEEISKEKRVPASRSYQTVSAALKDPLLSSKLAFFQSVSAEVEPFLTEFQFQKPLAPLLYESLVSIMRNVLSRFIKRSVLDSAKSIPKIDVSDKQNLLNTRDVDLGFATREAIRKAQVSGKISEKDLLSFCQDCANCLQAMCKKFQERSPLSYPLTKGISCLDPQIALRPSIRDARLCTALQVFVKKNQMSGATADKVQRQFGLICSANSFPQILNRFSRETDRLDDLWMAVLANAGKHIETSELTTFFKKVLILSHGNADLERGFSVNKEAIVENMSEQSLIAQRQVYDSVVAAGGLTKLTITKSMIHYFRNAHARYLETIKERRKAAEETDKAAKEKRKVKLQVRSLEEMKKKVLSNARKEETLINEQIKNLLSS